MKGIAGAFTSTLSTAAGTALTAGSLVAGAGAKVQGIILPSAKKHGVKRAKVRITMGDNVNDGMLGKARIVIVGDGKEIPDGPRAPAGSTVDKDGFDLGYVMWKYGSTVSATIDDLPENVNPMVILLYNDSSNGKWYVKKVEIETTAYAADGGGENGTVKKYVFPCFSFVPNSSGGRVIFEGNSRLPWQTPARINELYRVAALQKQQEVYKFDVYNDLSSPANLVDHGSANFRPTLHPYPKRQSSSISGKSVGIPIDDDFDFSKTYDFISEAVKATAKSLIADPLTFQSNRPWKSVSAMTSALFGGLMGLRKPAVLSSGVDWKSDKEFGRQTLAGVNPMEIQLLRALPQGFSVSDADLGNALPAGLTLAAAVGAKRVFILDYSLLETFRPIVNRPPADGKPSKYLYAPRCLLLRDDEGNVIPIAVELERGGKVYTRARDTSVGNWQWTLAKAYVATADSIVHQVTRHWLECHAIGEVYLVSLRRRVSEWHPLFKLLIPHFRFTMSINYRARTNLINADGIIESNFTLGPKCMALSQEMFKSWTFRCQALPDNLKKRGVYDKAVLPYFPYRDAGMLIWNAICKYVRAYLKIYYGEGAAASAAIAQDAELAAWWEDVKYGNSKSEFAADEREEWPAMETLEDLVFVCTTMIWNASAQHSAINFSQYDFSAFAPNHPTYLRKPMPEEVDEKTFMETLPLPRDQLSALVVVDLLSRFSDDEEYIGRLDQSAFGWLVDPAAQQAYKQFAEDLDDVQEAVKRMNEDNKSKGRLPYIYLFPRTNRDEFYAFQSTPNGNQGIPNSVSI
ncbi:hypothetical protein CBR_g76904 [Chara braunii]|uniref:Lipoxygenase domain-containing protein n=1 Tax=Chara braunii TaxID=69332 RepID=A0A388JK18_CHABU|nr:hypothetical protein CBR_g76904 [Chara braunii]|eukprot:GBG43316.1 hypothetical protein CBR_g76904 [Chara braunii]